MATKLQVIKKVLGKTLEQEGFRYIRYKRIGYHHWFYGREDGEWLQLLAVVEHDSLKEIWVVLFATLPTPNYAKILQIKRRYSIIHSVE